MIEMTSNDYYDFLEKVLERYEAGELSEEEAVQMVNDAVIDEWKSDHVNRMMYQMIIYHLVVIVNMMTVETLIIKLGVNPKEISKAEIILLTSLVERYNHGYMRRSIYFSYEEVLIKEAEGIIHGYLPEIDGIIYED